MAIALNLEIIVDENQVLLAYRYDLPEDMESMVLNAGHWCIYKEENLDVEVIVELKTLMGRLRHEICQN